jgi:CRISPR-associated endonuclease/helicase Cas3
LLAQFPPPPSFGLRHAERHGKDRVIIVIPYTSIIEQTAGEYRRALGELGSSVVEHHSAVDEEYELRDGLPSYDVEAERRRLATENWDAPLIVTTAVQFFESLDACTPSRCRKLHNIANSVVVLDEAQTLPPDLLAPTVWAMNELVEGYGVSLVLSTATQPALESPFPAVMNLRPIIPPELPRPPARVRVEFRGKEPLTWPSLAAELAALPQGLCITHQRRDARDLTREIDKVVGNQGTLHLSASMCPAHRSQRIAEVRARLLRSLPCRVVSTQLVEAGVDLDFPVVYRALAGFDSLAQAAGRANREGRLGERGGILLVFQAPTAPPPGLPRLAKESAEVLLRAADLMGREIDIFASENGRHYFRQYYAKINDKDRGTTAFRRDFRFQATAAAYRFIRDSGIAVIIPWGERGAQAVSDLETYGPSRERLRRIQPYTVSVYRADLEALLAQRAVRASSQGNDDARPGLYVLQDVSVYDPRFGLQVRETSPGDFII